MERHLVARDLPDAERLQELPPGLTVLLDEDVVRRAVPERRLVHAVDVRHDEVDPVLVERVEARPLHEHAADVLVHALDVRLVRRAVGVGVPEAHAARQELRRVVLGIGAVVLNHARIGELDPVVPEDRREERTEEVGPREFPEHVEDARAGLRGLRVAEECEREACVGEDHREEHLAADRADDGVDLAGDDARVLLEPFAHLLDGPSDAALRIGLDLHLLRPCLASAGEGQVVLLREQEVPVDPVVHRTRTDPVEELGVARDDMTDGLSLLHAEGDDAVELLERLRVDVDSEAARVKRPLVVRLCAGGAVVLLAEGAVRLAFAPVADVRGLGPALAAGLEEPRAAVEAARGVLAQARREPVELRQLAFIEAAAELVGAPESLLAVDAAVLDFARDRRLGASEVLGDLGDCLPTVEQVLDAASFIGVHVLCHGVVPFVWFGGVRKAPPDAFIAPR